MLNVLKLFCFALTAVMLSCADYPALDLSIKYGEDIEDKRDGKKYKTVIIGKQEWMAENLNYDDTIGKCYDDKLENCKALGRLYTWAEAMELVSTYIEEPYQGICPKGWHLPSYEEWVELLDYVGYRDGLKLKTTSGWDTKNGTDEYGFSAKPAGFHYEDQFQKIRKCGAWWSISEIEPTKIKSIQICDDEADIISFLKASWASIRCIKD